MTNVFLLLAEAALYFGVMVSFFRLRQRIGIGVFLCALGVMHFLETYLASIFYVATPLGMLSPGSTVLFAGKLVMLLLLYMKEDAATVRQPIYGLFLGNALMVGLVLVIRLHDIAALPSNLMPDMAFIDEMGWLMVWGTALLFVDAILLILLYEKLGQRLRNWGFLRIAISVGVILTLDQVGFYAALRIVADAPIEVFLGGWAGKMGATLVYSLMLVTYLRYFEHNGRKSPAGLTDVFETLTYRERYEALVEHSGRDALTDLLHRGRFDDLGQHAVAESQAAGKPLTLLILDVDHFKAINDRHGHAQGDRVLKAIAALLTRTVGADDKVFRIGGEEFAVLCPYPHVMGKLLGENLRQAVKSACSDEATPCSVSIGVATLDRGTRHLAELFAVADGRLYAAKASGRDRVVGEAGSAPDDLRAIHA